MHQSRHHLPPETVPVTLLWCERPERVIVDPRTRAHSLTFFKLALLSTWKSRQVTSSPASFSNYGIFVPKARAPSSSNEEIVHIVELCPTVDSPLRRNTLPKEIQESNTLTKFKTQLRNHLHINFDKSSVNICMKFAF